MSLHHFSIIALVLSFAPFTQAQITTVDSTPSTPVEGAGHDYIHFLSETVNPSNGSISLRIELPTPRGRGLTLPFSIDYDSGSANQLGGQGMAGWTASTGTLNQGGWSYASPAQRWPHNRSQSIGIRTLTTPSGHVLSGLTLCSVILQAACTLWEWDP